MNTHSLEIKLRNWMKEDLKLYLSEKKKGGVYNLSINASPWKILVNYQFNGLSHYPM